MVKTFRPIRVPVFALLGVLLAGCDMLGIESPEALAAQRAAEGKAVGGACRHAGRAIEDCFTLNRKAEKAAVFSGWREMNDYMRENKIPEVAPQIESETKPPAARSDESEREERPAKKASKH
ncbi:MAG: hypothetical protein OEY03_03245 [Rhizobacter sp.]|nr:hypothetical protein [Rhizobacter sp.]